MARVSERLPVQAAETPVLTRVVGEEDRFVRIARDLENASLDELGSYWRQHFGRFAPVSLSRNLLYRLLIYRLQAEAFGDLDSKTLRLLDAIARDGKHADTDLRRTGTSPGTVLVREHDGIEHRVVVTEAGYFWNNQDFRSLSQIAHAITGTKWNGPRFFGLRSTNA